MKSQICIHKLKMCHESINLVTRYDYLNKQSLFKFKTISEHFNGTPVVKIYSKTQEEYMHKFNMVHLTKIK